MQGGYSGVADRIALPCLHPSSFILYAQDDDLWSSLHTVRLSIPYVHAQEEVLVAAATALG